jgi:spore coat protein U-like protein
MKPTLPVLALGILASALAARPVSAATATPSISVTATVQASCLAAVTATAIRTYAAAADAASAVSVACSNSTPYNVSLVAALAPGATGTIRELSGSGFAMLGYALGLNSRGIVNQGQSVGTYKAGGSVSGSAPLLAINDEIPAAQCPTPDTYADTMMVVVTY